MCTDPVHLQVGCGGYVPSVDTTTHVHIINYIGVCKQWTGQLDWITGLDYWTALSMLSSGVDLQLEWAWVHIMLM